MPRPSLPDDFKSQLWAGVGIPVGLAVLARAAAEIEAGLKRRRGLLADLESRCATAAAELGALRLEIDGQRPDPDGHPTPDALCIAPGCRAPAPGRAWHCADHADEPAPDGRPVTEVTATQ